MSEGGISLEVPVQDKPSPSSQRRFDFLMEANRRMVFQTPEVSGVENLAELPQIPLVIATSHFSDADVQTTESVLRPALNKVRPDRSLGISLQSHNLEDPATAIPIRLVGREHFFPYDVRFNKAARYQLRFRFNPLNFREMALALQQGRDIITAAHEPLSNREGAAWELPPRAGLGAAYLAQLARAAVLPVAVDIQTDHPVGMAADIGGAIKRLIKRERPKVRVIIGKPLTFEEIDNQSLALFERYASGDKTLSSDDQAKAIMVRNKLRQQSDVVMQSIADLLPEKKRGRWKGSKAKPLI